MRWICIATARNSLTIVELRRRLGSECIISKMMKTGRLHWLGHMKKMEENE